MTGQSIYLLYTANSLTSNNQVHVAYQSVNKRGDASEDNLAWLLSKMLSSDATSYFTTPSSPINARRRIDTRADAIDSGHEMLTVGNRRAFLCLRHRAKSNYMAKSVGNESSFARVARQTLVRLLLQKCVLPPLLVVFWHIGQYCTRSQSQLLQLHRFVLNCRLALIVSTNAILSKQIKI